MSATVIRLAGEGDLEAILAIYNDAVIHTTATYDYEPRTLENRRAWFIEHQRINFPIFVAESGQDGVTGWSALNRYHDRPGYRFTAETSVYVAALHRGRGLGSQLVAPLIESARALGLHALIAAIDADNAVSVRLHQRLGFTLVGRFAQVGYKFDRWLDVVYLQLLLPMGNSQGQP